MSSTQPCPPKITWQTIVEDGFEDFFGSDLSAHLDSCADCQALVERLMGRQCNWLAIAAELRQELPPASPICQRVLLDLKSREPLWAGGDLALESDQDHDTFEKRVFCPHCLELVEMETAVAGKVCPNCGQAADAAVGKGKEERRYDVDRPANPHKGQAVQDYVKTLEDRARKEEAKEPYRKKKFPIDLVAGWLLIAAGVGLFATAFKGEYNLLSIFVGIVLPAFSLILIGALCLVFWSK